MKKDHSADILGNINRRLLRATGIQNHSAGSLAFGSASGFAGRPVAFGSLGGFGRHRGGRSSRLHRDFVASADA
jgi:hypothetical protein